ncbi:MAG TPA: DUF5825 family protein [Nonomuraea sp.]|nr:DUF5825 family protein [Nonomuraea sp.]
MTPSYEHLALDRPRTHTLDHLVDLDTNAPARASKFIAWLRERQSEAENVVWHAHVDPALDPTLLYHLPPPLSVAGHQAPSPHPWLAAHRPAMCHYRMGPGFILVQDVRQPSTAARFELDEPALIDAFTHCLRPRQLTDLDGNRREAALALVAERLALRLGDWVTTLPTRMRRWPTPSPVV